MRQSDSVPLRPSWLFRIQWAPSTPKALKLSDDPNKYYAGAKPFYYALPASSHAAAELTTSLSALQPWPLKHACFSTAYDLVTRVLGDPKALVLKMAALPDRHDAPDAVLMLHAIDLDVEDLTKEDKEALRARLSAATVPTVQELCEAFPPFQQCYQQAVQLQKAAPAGAHIISTGFKGFRVLLLPHPKLYMHTARSVITGSLPRKRALVQARLCAYLQLPQLPASVDYSIWGDNLGVRTNLHPHPATGLWPHLIDDDLTRAYGSRTRDTAAHNAISAFWQSVLEGLPTALGQVEEQEAPPSPPPPPPARRPRSPQPKKKKQKKQKKKQKQEEEEEQPEPPVVHDEYADVCALLAAHNLQPQRASLAHATPGAPVVHVIVEKPPDLACARAQRVHARNTFCAHVHRVSGDVTMACTDPQCQDADYAWPVFHTPNTLGAQPGFALIARSGLKNHADLAVLLAPLVQQRTAFDADKGKWRLYDNALGTWRLCAADVEAPPIMRHALVTLLERFVELTRQCIVTLPVGSKARVWARKLIAQLEGHIESSGHRTFLGHLAASLLPHLCVAASQWNAHFSGHLPVSNGLLRFDQHTGLVEAIPYAPHLYVRAEYQATACVWDPLAPPHEGLDALLSEWWDADERRAALELLAYGLSRHGFLQIIVFFWGPPSSAKSSSLELFSAWLGVDNIFTHTSPALIVQRSTHGARDDDGKGHDAALLTCFDKAIVAFPEPSSTRSVVLRDDVVKRMTGEQLQSGRQAYARELTSCARTYLPMVPCNSLPKPQNPADLAMQRRIALLTSHRVFFTSPQHRADVEARFTPEQRREAELRPAIPGRINSVRDDPAAATHFLNLLAAAWLSFVVDGHCAPRPAPLATRVLASYWASLRTDQDSVVAFLAAQVSLAEPDNALPKHSLWLAYSAWYDRYSQTNGSPGPRVTKENAFKMRVKAFYEHSNITDTRPTARVLAFQNGALKLGPPQSQVHCYRGLTLLPHGDAYEVE